MEKFYYDRIIGQCCIHVPQYLAKFNASPYPDYLVLLCPLHLNQKPYDKNILLIKDLDSVELVKETKERNANA